MTLPMTKTDPTSRAHTSRIMKKRLSVLPSTSSKEGTTKSVNMKNAIASSAMPKRFGQVSGAPSKAPPIGSLSVVGADIA